MKFKSREEMESSLNGVTDILERLDKSYSVNWAREMYDWAGPEVYDRASGLLEDGLGSESTHVDLGCGFGNFLFLLKKNYPDRLLYGVELNYHVITDATAAFHHMHIPFNLAICRGLKYSRGNDSVLRIPQYNEKFKEADFQNARKVQLICDDIRSMNVLKEILSGKKIDSGSFLMPGISMSAALESPYSCDTPDPDIFKSRIGEIMDKVRSGAYLFMAEHLKENGRLVVAENIDASRPEGEPLSAKAIEKKMGFSNQYFDVENATYFGSEEGAVLFSLTRNDRPLTKGSFVYQGKKKRNK